MFSQGESKKFLFIVEKEPLLMDFEGEVFKRGNIQLKKAPLTACNAAALRDLFPWTAPQPFGSDSISIGLGDRLGLASPGHIKAIENTSVRPVLAQQSIRELELTNRTYTDVLDAAGYYRPNWATSPVMTGPSFRPELGHIPAVVIHC